MNDIDLNKYKSAWKAEENFGKMSLSESDINIFLKKRSKDTNNLLTKTLTVDISIKSIFAISFIYLSFLFAENASVLLLNIFMFLLTTSSVYFLAKAWIKIPHNNYSEENLKSLLESKINFYSTSYYKSLYLVALTNPILFISGSLYYYYFKYGSIVNLSVIDYSVLLLFVIVGYILGIYVQIKYHNFHFNQLSDCLAEINGNTINEIYIKNQKRKRIQVIMLSVLLVIIGIIILLFLNLK